MSEHQDFSSPAAVLVLGVALGLSFPVPAETEPGLSDPTRPHGWRAAEQSDRSLGRVAASPLVLQGTFNNAGQRSAVVNGRRVSVGDRVEGAEVVEIENNKVVLRIAGETTEFAAPIPVVKSPTNSKGEDR